MDRRRFLLSAVLGLSALSLLAATPPQSAWTTKCKVIRVVDGDTVDVEVRQVIRIRLLDCWAPERYSPEGKASKAALEQLLAADTDGEQIVSIPLTGRLQDSLTLDRMLGQVWLNPDSPQSVSESQVAAGHAQAAKP